MCKLDTQPGDSYIEDSGKHYPGMNARDAIDDKPTLVQVMPWRRQEISHYLNQYRPRSPTVHGVTRPQWVNLEFTTLTLGQSYDWPRSTLWDDADRIWWYQVTIKHNKTRTLCLIFTIYCTQAITQRYIANSVLFSEISLSVLDNVWSAKKH